MRLAEERFADQADGDAGRGGLDGGAEAGAAGLAIATMAFPRYGVDVHADLVRDALYGRLGDVSDSVYGLALLFALDRRAAADEISRLVLEHDLVILDRYVSSNAAYGAARLGGPDVDTGFPQWVADLEVFRFGVPVPDRQVLLATPPALSAERARGRAAVEADRPLDRFEADAALQTRTGEMYRRFAADSYLSPWTVVTPDVAPADVLSELLAS